MQPCAGDRRYSGPLTRDCTLGPAKSGVDASFNLGLNMALQVGIPAKAFIKSEIQAAGQSRFAVGGRQYAPYHLPGQVAGLARLLVEFPLMTFIWSVNRGTEYLQANLRR